MGSRNTNVVTGGPRGRVRRESPVIATTAFLILALVLSPRFAPVSAAAESSITEITLVYSNTSTVTCPDGFTKVPVDLNQDVGGAYIYLCYKRGVGAPITSLVVTANNQMPDSRYWDKAYDVINDRDGNPLNLNRGVSGAFPVWLWYTKDPACTTVREVRVSVNGNGDPSAGSDWTKTDHDMNYSLKSTSIFLWYLAM